MEPSQEGKNEKDYDIEIPLGRSVLHLGIHYPEENPKDTTDSIVNAMERLGLFENLS